jgi:hypothetical protein
VDDTSPPANGTLLSTVVNTSFDGGGAVTAEAVVGEAGPMLALDVPPGSVASAGSYTYTLTYGNAGASAVNAELSLRLPLGATFQSATGGGTLAGDVVTWTIGTLAAGQTDRQQVTLQAPASPAGTILMAEAQLRDPATLHSHARASASATVGTPLEITVSTLPDPVQPGQNVSYVITVANLGSVTTNTINLLARVPNHTMVPADQDESGFCSSTGNFTTDCLAGQTLGWQISLLPGASLSRTFTAVVDDTSPPANGTLLSTVVNTSFDGGGAVTGEAVVGVVDTDGDGVIDDNDNCTLVPNSDQRDTDGDGYGNLCDGDLNNTGTTNTLDLNLYKLAHRTRVGDANYNADADFNGDDRINTLDLNIYKGLHRKPPGPSCCGIF